MVIQNTHRTNQNIIMTRETISDEDHDIAMLAMICTEAKLLEYLQKKKIINKNTQRVYRNISPIRKLYNFGTSRVVTENKEIVYADSFYQIKNNLSYTMLKIQLLRQELMSWFLVAPSDFKNSIEVKQ